MSYRDALEAALSRADALERENAELRRKVDFLERRVLDAIFPNVPKLEKGNAFGARMKTDGARR